MALSNYATLAFNEKGEPCDGKLVTPLDVEVEIYKDWLYIHDARAWRDGGAFVEPCVMEIQSGVVRYLDLHVVALRGPRGIYAVAWHGFQYQENLKGFIGCGVYAYDDDGNEIGVDVTALAWFRHEVVVKDLNVPQVFLDLNFGKAAGFNQGTAYIGSVIPQLLETLAGKKG